MKILINFFQSAANKENTQKIKTKTDKEHHRRKLFDLFDPGHDLGYPVKHTDAHKGQHNTIDDVKYEFAFIHGTFLAVVQFFRIHDVFFIFWLYIGFKGSSETLNQARVPSVLPSA